MDFYSICKNYRCKWDEKGVYLLVEIYSQAALLPCGSREADDGPSNYRIQEET